MVLGLERLFHSLCEDSPHAILADQPNRACLVLVLLAPRSLNRKPHARRRDTHNNSRLIHISTLLMVSAMVLLVIRQVLPASRRTVLRPDGTLHQGHFPRVRQVILSRRDRWGHRTGNWSTKLPLLQLLQLLRKPRSSLQVTSQQQPRAPRLLPQQRLLQRQQLSRKNLPPKLRRALLLLQPRLRPHLHLLLKHLPKRRQRAPRRTASFQQSRFPHLIPKPPCQPPPALLHKARLKPRSQTQPVLRPRLWQQPWPSCPSPTPRRSRRQMEQLTL